MEHCFKVVATKEKNGICFTAVPHLWEREGTLFWPDYMKHSEREKLRQDAASEPQEIWNQMKCLIKWKCAKNFTEALEIEKKISKCTDTDAEEELFDSLLSKKKTSKEQSQEENFMVDRNNLFLEEEEVRQDDCQLPSISVTEPLILASEGEISKIINSLEQLKNDIVAIKLEMKRDYGKLQLSLDGIHDILVSKNVQRVNSVENVENFQEKFLLPVSTHDELVNLDHEIKSNKHSKKQLIEILVKIGGSSGDEDGVKIGYKLADVVFKSDLLTSYSWTGVSKDKTEKLAFQKFEGITDVFFETLLLADRRFTKQKTFRFFMNGILKHAKKRSQRKKVKPENENLNFVAEVEPNGEDTELSEQEDI